MYQPFAIEPCKETVKYMPSPQTVQSKKRGRKKDKHISMDINQKGSGAKERKKKKPLKSINMTAASRKNKLEQSFALRNFKK